VPLCASEDRWLHHRQRLEPDKHLPGENFEAPFGFVGRVNASTASASAWRGEEACGLGRRFLFPYGNFRYLSGVAFYEAVHISNPPFNGTGAVGGGAPWTTTSGHAEVDLKTGSIDFRVKGLVLAVGGNATAKLSGLDIGTPAGVTQVKGTLVCNVSGAVNAGNSVLVDTGAVPLSAQGNASFSGMVGPLPSECGTSDIAFLIRIVQPVAFANLWIAAGGVLTVDGDDH
jgi:hypothetical protein